MRNSTPDLLARLRAGAPAGSDLAFRAPGRANLIGEHTDYNDGFALPVALQLATYVVGARFPGILRLCSLDEPDVVEVDLGTGRGPEQGWGRYATAVVRALRDERVPLRGFDGIVGTELPIGAGLASSAALEVAVALSVLAAPLSAVRLARTCQRAESEYVGVRCGVLDQLAVAAGRAGAALLVDCRSLEVTPVPLPADVRVLLVDSGVPRDLAGSAYNERRIQCEAAARAMGVPSLREAGATLLDQVSLDDVLRRRARHVLSENARVLTAVELLTRGDVAGLGPVFAASHCSLAEDYAVSTPELDELVAIAGRTPGVFASRLTGAGFGGSTVNLVQVDRAEAVAKAILVDYQAATGRSGRAWVSVPAAGAGPFRLTAVPG